MTRKTKLKEPLRIGLLGALGSLLFTANPSFAQDGDQDAIEEVVVTGSRIAQDEFSSMSPLATFDAEDLAKSGTISVDEFLKDVPAFTGFQLGASTNNGGDGQKKVDMRGLGFKRTLVLINGRRTVGDATGDGAVDLNTVPMAMVKRIDVLKDGASTIYGSDALAGVVNFVLYDDFDGVQFDMQAGESANDYNFSFLGGVSGDRGNVMMSLGYSHQEELLQGDRDWAENALYPLLNTATGAFEATPSGSSNSRRIRVDGVGSFIVDETSGQARPFESGDVYNYAPVNALITPFDIWQFATSGNLEIAKDTSAFFETIYTKRSSHQRLAPDASFAVTDVPTPNNGLQMNDWVPAENPYNPFGVNPNNTEGLSGLDVRINRRFVESGGRIFEQNNDTFRMVAGFEGEIAGAVNWDVSYTYAESQTLDETKNYGRFDRWATAVDPAACAADSACPGVLNPFGPYGSITSAQMDYLTAGSLKDQYKARTVMFQANVSGDLMELPGGTAGWAVGYENRREHGSYTPDEFVAEGLTTGGAGDPLRGGFGVEEVYGEVRLPILENFLADLSTRYSDYDTSAGSTATYKVGVEYQPLEDVKLTAGYATGFRAPNIQELNQQDTGTFPLMDSPCEFGDRRLAAGEISQTTYDNCQALGADTTDAGELGFAWQSYQVITASAAELEPEESTTITFGITYEPSAVEGLRLRADYWDIEIEEVIGTEDPNLLLQSCLASPGMTSPGCSVFFGDPLISLGGPYWAPNDLETPFGNLGTLRTNGWDFEAAYTGNIDNRVVSGYNLLWSATWQESYEREFPLSGTRELVGTANAFEVFPEWRFNVTAGLFGENWTFDWRMRYIDETMDALRSPAVTDDAVAEDILYHDLVGTFTWQNVDLTFGVNNVTDEDPPRFHSAFNANTEPGMYDVIGRRFFAGARVSF